MVTIPLSAGPSECTGLSRWATVVERFAASSGQPRIGLILGTGWGGLVECLSNAVVVPYSEIPGFILPRAPGHAGQLHAGTIGNVDVVALAGRVHLYEGCEPQEVIKPVELLAGLGVDSVILTNAAGGLRPGLSVGDLIVAEDDLNLQFRSATAPLIAGIQGGGRGTPGAVHSVARGAAAAVTGPSARPVAAPPLYDPLLAERALTAARHVGAVASRGVYVGVLGPNYETRAEYRAFRRLGGDVVGMSTVLEARRARHLGLRVLGLSIVTNVCVPDAPTATSAGEVHAAAQGAEAKLRAVLVRLVQTCWC